MSGGELYVVETWGASWSRAVAEWRYCTGVRPSAEREKVELALGKYSAGRAGRYRVAVYVRDVARTRVLEGAGPGLGPSTACKPGPVRKRNGGAA